jgi:hypothetical protein
MANSSRERWKMNVDAVYELMPMLDTPGYACFDMPDDTPVGWGESIMADLRPRDVCTRHWQVQRLAPLWRRREVINVLPDQVNDYPTIGLIIPLFSQRAVDLLRDLLEPNGEILPVTCKTGQYCVYNVTTVADVLDREASDMDWGSWYKLKKLEPVVAREIRYYSFIPDRLSSLAIFRIPEDITGYYVTERFAERVRQHDLKGFNLRKVWPLPRPQKPGGLGEMERRAGLR